MPTSLCPYRYQEFADRLQELAPGELSTAALEALYLHYQELRRWSRRLSLIGPGTAAGVLERHYGESLAALPLLPPAPAELVDLGSGAGFPGLVLAAARPDLSVTLIEARERKWAFLETAARKASLPCRCLNVRVGLPLPPGLPREIDVLTTRALRLNDKTLSALAQRLAPGGSLLLWSGAGPPRPPAGLVPGRSLPLPGSQRRRILELHPAAGGAGRRQHRHAEGPPDDGSPGDGPRHGRPGSEGPTDRRRQRSRSEDGR